MAGATFVKNGGEQRTFAKRLKDEAGYRTALIGKYLNGYGATPTTVPPGWTEWYAGVDNALYRGYGYTLNENGRLVKYGNAPADYATDVIRDKAVDFIRRSDASDAQPFALYVSPTAPHQPIPPAPRDASNPYVNATVPRTPNFNERNLADEPSWLRVSGDRRAAQVSRTVDRDYAKRMGSLYAVDEMVGAIVDQLRTSRELDNTYVVFTSDNGYNLGSHRLVQKMAPYEESARVPLVITGPGVGAGTTTDAMTLNIDFAPTFLDLAGLPIPADIDGRSLAPLLRGARPAWRADYIGQYASTAGSALASEALNGAGELVAYRGLDIPSYRSIRTQTHLYVEWWASRPIERELYDLRADPFQLRNLLATRAGRRTNAALATALRARLDTLAACSGASCRS